MVQHIKGDIFDSNAEFILHQVNCQGIMGSGVAKQVRSKYPWVFAEYKRFCNNNPQETSALLGNILPVYINENQQIVNLFAQDRYGYDGKCYTSYDALSKCLESVSKIANGKNIAIPYLMGCHRGGGDWKRVNELIKEKLFSCNVVFYEYNGGDNIASM